MTREREAPLPEENFPQQGFNHPKKSKFIFVIVISTDLIFGWFIHIWELWKPWRRRWEERNKFAYLAMKTVLYAGFARAIIFAHSAAVFVLSATCCGLFWHLCRRREHSATTFSFVLFMTKVCFFNLSFGKLIQNLQSKRLGLIKLYDCRNVKLHFWMRSRGCRSCQFWFPYLFRSVVLWIFSCRHKRSCLFCKE